MKRNILKIILCSAFFIISCSGGKDKQLEKDSKFISDQQDRLLECAKHDDFKVRNNLDDCFSKRMSSQFLIAKYNSIQSIIDSGYSKLNEQRFLLKGNLISDSVKAETFRELKKEFIAVEDEKRYVAKYFTDILIRFSDSCLRVKHDASLELDLSANKLELLLLKNQINDLFGQLCTTITACHWGWKPFSDGLATKNYQRDKRSFLEIKFQYYIGPKFFKELRPHHSEMRDTISISNVRISFLRTSDQEIDSTSVKLDLSNLKPGKYRLDACVVLLRPNTKSTTFCEPIDFEVFK